MNGGGRFAQVANMLNRSLEKNETRGGRLDNPFIGSIPVKRTEPEKVEPKVETKVEDSCVKLQTLSYSGLKEEDYKKIREEMEEIMNKKMGKVDEILSLLKEGNSFTKKEEVAQNTPIFKPQPIITTTEKKIRTKKSYYPITETMWNDLKVKFAEFPEELKSKVFSDGESYYVEMQNKKNLLDNKLLLKLLNKKKTI